MPSEQTSRPAMDILYQSETLTAWFNRGAGDQRPAAIVTFESVGIAVRKHTDQYFGASLADRLGVNIIHVVPRDVEWYQYADMDACLAAIRPHTDADTLPYGSSMGGYAVAHFTERLGLRRGLCFSPQVSIQRSVVPFENRWKSESDRIAFLHDDVIAPRSCLLWVFTDPQDARELEHAERIAASGPCHIIPVPDAGHPVGRGLKEIGALPAVLVAFLENREHVALFAEMIGDKVSRTVTGMLERAQRARGRERMQLLAEALRAFPDDPEVRFRQGVFLLRKGKTDEAHEVLADIMVDASAKMMRVYRAACKRRGIDPVLLKG